MSDTLSRLQQIKRRHDSFNRLITLLLSAFVCTIGFSLWLAKVPVLDEYKPGTGLVIMGFAALFYKTPHVAYWLNRRHFADDAETLRLMGDSWQDYKLRILNV